jgi:hypothetical protein
METKIVKIENINENFIVYGTPTEKPIPNTNQKYTEISIDYNYGTKDKPFLGQFYIELPEVVSNYGITVSDLNGKKKSSIQISLPLTNDDSKSIIEGINKVYMSAAENIYNNKGILRMKHFNKENPEASNFKNPIFYPRDKVNFEIIPGKSPNIYIPLLERGTNRTTFCDLRENILPWKYLSNVEMKLIPLIQIEKIYLGVKPSLQYKMISCVVTSIVSKSSLILQKGTISSLKDKNPELVNVLDSQIDALKNSLKVSDVDGESPPTSPRNTGYMQEQPTPVINPPMKPGLNKQFIPRVNVESNIDSFLKS